MLLLLSPSLLPEDPISAEIGTRINFKKSLVVWQPLDSDFIFV